MRRIFFFILIFLHSYTATAAEITFVDVQGGTGHRNIRLSGVIEEGDADKLLRTALEDPESFFRSFSIQLSSPGGSVEEALKIAKIIESAGLIALVSPSETCASSCFLLFVGAQVRANLGSILIHRPYFSADAVSPDVHAAYLARTEHALVAMRQLLLMKAVPSSLIDKMMSLPSSQAYELTWQDSMSIAVMNPLVEELAINKCGTSNATFYGNLQKNLTCLQESVLVHQKLRFTLQHLGPDRTWQAAQAAFKLMQAAEQSHGDNPANGP